MNSITAGGDEYLRARWNAKRHPKPHCAFCGAGLEKPGQFVASPEGMPLALICSECIEVCAGIIEPRGTDAD